MRIKSLILSEKNRRNQWTLPEEAHAEGKPCILHYCGKHNQGDPSNSEHSTVLWKYWRNSSHVILKLTVTVENYPSSQSDGLCIVSHAWFQLTVCCNLYIGESRSVSLFWSVDGFI